ncbi:siderophore-interacting protein [Pseudonocardia tropica]|uniref:Siderophore-interacting protein n=1 Tax=Pseudonocardia tropica TaxID=681289 RepID=A0ABV1JVF1_9PSEU
MSERQPVRSSRWDVDGNVAAAFGRGTGQTKVPYPILLRELEVLRTRELNPSLLRLTLGGDGLAGFQSHPDGAEEHVRLVFPDENGELRLPEQNEDTLNWGRPRPVSREYTVRHFDADAGELDIDLVLHPGGLASEWVRTVVPGTRIHVAGPPGGLVVPQGYDFWLLAGDLTAQPAIARILERLPADARGVALVEVADAAEELPMTAPDGVEVRWLHRDGAPAGTSEVLWQAVRDVRPPDGASVYAWVAGETTSIKPIRRFVRDELGLAAEHREVNGYWKRGVVDFDDDDDEAGHGHGHGHGH